MMSRATSPSRIGLAAMLFAAAIVTSSPTPADTHSPPQADDELLPLLYETLGGDSWHNNDGWLDPEVHWCDWHGVICGEEIEPGHFELYAIDLADNNLTGEIAPALANLLASSAAPETRLDLRRNAIEGGLQQLPLFTERVRLGNNRLSGPLPSIDPGAVTDGLTHLELDNNLFEGEVPSSWEALSLILLDLSNNQLEGTADSAFQALDPDQADFIYLTDNAFAGELPAWITELSLESDFGTLGSIDICWTDLSVSDPETREWVSERHVGGTDLGACLDRTRRSIGPEVAGSWYEPARSGEGYSVMLLDNGVPLIYWFSHLSHSRQLWLIGTGRHDDTTLLFDDLLSTEGRFGYGSAGFDDPVARKGEQRLDGVAEERLHLTSRINYNLSDLSQPDGGPIISMPNPIDFRTDLVRLSELAGTTCDNQSEFQKYSGVWYNPERSGEGFVVEVLPDDRAVIYWFTYQPDESGDQAWMIGQGNIDAGDDICTILCDSADATIAIETMFQPIDSGQTFPGDLSGVETLEWGGLQLSFSNEDTGHISFQSQIDGFGSGDYPIERLARPMLAECADGEAK